MFMFIIVPEIVILCQINNCQWTELFSETVSLIGFDFSFSLVLVELHWHTLCGLLASDCWHKG